MQVITSKENEYVKHIKKLKEKGYHIISSTKKGYCLTEDNDIILIENIKSAIPDFFQNIKYLKFSKYFTYLSSLLPLNHQK